MAIQAESILSVDYLMFTAAGIAARIAARIAIPGSHFTVILESTQFKFRYCHVPDPT